MAPSRRLRRRLRQGLPAFRSSFFRALALRRRPWPRTRRKRARASGRGCGRSSAADAPAPDLLSALPDCLLHVILSSLKARQVVQTCVLSKRWRHLWRSVPCLDVDVDDFKTKPAAAAAAAPGSSSSVDDKAMNWMECGKFVDFAVNLVQRCNIALLDSLALHGRGDRTPLLFLRYATRSFIQRDRLSPGSWRLKKLQLTQVPLDDCFETHVGGAGCYPLEELLLEGCVFEIPSIFFDSLKFLYLKHCRWGQLSEIAASPTLKTFGIFGELNKPLVISAPAVADLHLALKVHGCAAGGVSIKEMMPSLDKAFIQIYCRSPRYYVPQLSDDRFKYLHSVSNVTSLDLYSVGRRVLGNKLTSNEFQNLKNLLLDDCDLSDDCILEFFLRRSPNLEKLTLRDCKLSDDTEVKPVLRLKTADFLRENLKIEIVYNERDTRHLNEFMMRVSGNQSENYAKLLIHVDLKCRL